MSAETIVLIFFFAFVILMFGVGMFFLPEIFGISKNSNSDKEQESEKTDT